MHFFSRTYLAYFYLRNTERDQETRGSETVGGSSPRGTGTSSVNSIQSHRAIITSILVSKPAETGSPSMQIPLCQQPWTLPSLLRNLRAKTSFSSAWLLTFAMLSLTRSSKFFSFLFFHVQIFFSQSWSWKDIEFAERWDRAVIPSLWIAYGPKVYGETFPYLKKFGSVMSQSDKAVNSSMESGSAVHTNFVNGASGNTETGLLGRHVELFLAAI